MGFAVKLIQNYGIPMLEKEMPAVIPLVKAIIDALDPKVPEFHPQLEATARQFNECVGVACVPTTVKE